MTMPRFLPLGLDLEGASCVVVGGGQVASRKVRTLLEAGARVTVIAPRLTAELSALSAAGRVHWLAQPFAEALLGPALLVVAATDDESVNQQVGQVARARGALLCDASSGERSQVIFGALHRSEDATVAVFTNGRDPARARRIRDRIAGVPIDSETAREPGAPAAGRLIVIAHGSRDARWRHSIEQVIGEVQEIAGAGALALAYMDRAPPTLADAVAAAVADGCRHLRVLPLFLAPQGHVDKDIRPLVEAARLGHPEVTIEFLPPIGQLPEFRDLLRRLAAGQPAGASSERKGTSAGGARRPGSAGLEANGHD